MNLKLHEISQLCICSSTYQWRMNASNKFDTCVYNILVKENVNNVVIFKHIIYSRNSEGDVRSLL
jgi:hypothetical protein